MYGTDPVQTYNPTKYTYGVPAIYKHTVLGQISTHTPSHAFAKLVRSVARLASKLNDSQTSITLFVPLQFNQPENAEQFILDHMFDRPINPEYFDSHLTMIQNMRNEPVYFQTCKNAIYINKHSKILYRQCVKNSVIYFIDTPYSRATYLSFVSNW